MHLPTSVRSTARPSLTSPASSRSLPVRSSSLCSFPSPPSLTRTSPRTGGSSGIGLEISLTLLANGAKVYIVGNDEDEVRDMAERYSRLIEEQGAKGKIEGFVGDCSNKAEGERIASEIAKKEEYVTVLFNNAGMMGSPVKLPEEKTGEAYKKAFFALTDDDFRKVSALNTVGPYFLSIAFLPLLSASKSKAPYGDRVRPQIINTTSMNGFTKDPDTADRGYPYMLSKAALAHLTSLLAHDFLPLGVRVNQIAPGLFASKMAAPGKAGEWGIADPNVNTAQYGYSIPAGVAGSTEDVGSVALALIVNRFINGESILVDGGTLLVHPSHY
ncbi:hypothetical protein JCM8547_003536 [Rhodosporidiobolus lusitaniae]